MLSLLFLGFALIHFSIWCWGWGAWSRNGRPRGLFLVLFGGTLLWYDNFRIGIGRFIGEGEILAAMTVPAFAWHWTMLPLLVIAAGSIAKQSGLRWAQPKAVMGAFCVVASAFIALDVPNLFQIDLHLACVADTLRYTTRVSELQFCTPDAVVVNGVGSPLVAILTNVIVLGVGIALWIQRGWAWMALGSGAMFLAAGMGPPLFPLWA
ncbi:MAG: hypothetical protein ACR2QB_08555, partial [Gammaproteobacteria bacterium]